jgi:hypothetical protein
MKIMNIDLDSPNLSKILIMVSRELELLNKLAKQKNNGYTIRLLDVFIPTKALEEPTQLDQICLITDYVELNLHEILTNPNKFILDE